jgi:hypothetical protein
MSPPKCHRAWSLALLACIQAGHEDGVGNCEARRPECAYRHYETRYGATFAREPVFLSNSSQRLARERHCTGLQPDQPLNAREKVAVSAYCSAADISVTDRRVCSRSC